jgi:hypothetical protein
MKYPNDAKFHGSEQNMAMTISASSVFLLHLYTHARSTRTQGRLKHYLIFIPAVGDKYKTLTTVVNAIKLFSML